MLRRVAVAARGERPAEVAEVAHRAHRIDPPAVEDGHPRAVVPAVFELLQPGEQHGPDVS
jgi:hypothetical protein